MQSNVRVCGQVADGFGKVSLPDFCSCIALHQDVLGSELFCLVGAATCGVYFDSTV